MFLRRRIRKLRAETEQAWVAGRADRGSRPRGLFIERGPQRAYFIAHDWDGEPPLDLPSEVWAAVLADWVAR